MNWSGITMKSVVGRRDKSVWFTWPKEQPYVCLRFTRVITSLSRLQLDFFILSLNFMMKTMFRGHKIFSSEKTADKTTLCFLLHD